MPTAVHMATKESEIERKRERAGEGKREKKRQRTKKARQKKHSIYNRSVYADITHQR
jgi:uncharacterized protein (DUF169 family)